MCHGGDNVIEPKTEIIGISSEPERYYQLITL